MKRFIISLVFLFLLIGLSGCVTVPHHYTYVEEVIYYPPPPPPPEYYYPPVPPTPPIVKLPVSEPNPPRIRQPEKPNRGGGSDNQVRDPLRGHGERNPGPVHKPERTDGGRR